MFDFVLRRELLPRRRFGPAAGIAAVFYAGAASFVAWAEAQPRQIDRQDLVINFVAPPRAVPPRAAVTPVAPAPRPIARTPGPKAALPEGPRTVLVQAIVAPTEIPQARPPEQEPAPSAAADVDAIAEAGEVPAVPGGIGSDPVVDA